ncbi:MarR family winged helix-turn-helix transcriptional regulator [Actinoplanes sp. NPDC048967]|uniref:MarR family winged helix-turn-helix transcriptional regulator n=1 Tax=Actinoplanes sp. NPDC048967 TaxID=3155269 RepID=UPI0033CFD3A1
MPSPQPPGDVGPRPTADSEITWLLHRAAQRMRAATGDVAEQHGLTLREYIVLSALHKSPGLTQGELGKTLGLDKTTLMSQLDRLERHGFVVRHNDPRDRRLRIPVITTDGDALRAKVAAACETVESSALTGLDPDEIQNLRRLLVTVIGDVADRGSCL